MQAQFKLNDRCYAIHMACRVCTFLLEIITWLAVCLERKRTAFPLLTRCGAQYSVRAALRGSSVTVANF